ncbi:hypothetical protein EC968_006199 [Mortierella alpina]|nr:hypothetical protein EC968_006199 [Mortierella alpina]
MKFSASILLISAALATIASAAPLIEIVDINTAPAAPSLCSGCTSQDQSALNVIVQASADHYADIAQDRLDGLMREMETAKVTSGSAELPKEKATLTLTVQSRINDAKKACAPEALAAAIHAAIADDASLNIPWSKSEQAKRKMDDLNVVVERIILDLIQKHVSAQRLANDITQSMTKTVIEPIPETAAPVPESPAPTSAPAPVPETAIPAAGNDVAAGIGLKFMCISGCGDAEDANTVLALRDDLERQLTPRFQYLANKEIPAACSQSRSSLWDSIRKLLDSLDIKVNVKPSV